MAENDVRVTGIDDRAKQTLSEFGWATEATLAKLASNSQISVRLLQQIARSKGASDAAVANMQKAAEQVSKVAENGAKKLETTLGDISKNTRQSAENAIDQIGKLGTKGAANIGDAAGKTSAMLSKMTQGIKGLFTGPEKQFESVISDFGSGIKSWASSFQPSGILGKAVTAAVGIFGSLVSVIGSAVERLREMNTMVRTLYASGIQPAGGFERLAQTAIATGLTMQDLAKTMTNFGAVAANLGTKRMMALQTQIAKQTRLGADFMMNQQELQEAFGESMEMMRISNELSTATNDEIVARSTRTINMFNDLSQATGKNREELRKATAELMKSTKQFGLMRSAGKGSGEAIQGLMASLTAEFGSSAGQLADMVEGMFMGGPALVDEAMRPLLAIVPGFSNELEQVTQGIRSGVLDPKQAATKISDVIDRIDEGSLRTLRAANPALYSTIRQMQLNSQQARAARDKDATTSKEEIEAREKELEAQKARQAAFNEMDKAMTGLRTAFNMFLAKAVEPLMPVFRKLATMVSSLTEKFSNSLSRFFNSINWDEKTKAIGDWLDALDPDKIIADISSFLTGVKDATVGIFGFLNRIREFLGIDTTTAIISLLSIGAGGLLVSTLTSAAVMAGIAKLMSSFGGNRGQSPANPIYVQDIAGSGRGVPPTGTGDRGGRQQGGGRGRTPPAQGGGRAGMMAKLLSVVGAGANVADISGAAAGGAQGGGTMSNVVNTGLNVASALGFAARLVPSLAAMAGDTALGALGVGSAEIDESQDEKNWQAMSSIEKLQSGTAQVIENIGSMFGLSNMVNQARAERIKSETEYLKLRGRLPASGETQSPIDIREIEATMQPLQDQTVKDLNEEFSNANAANADAMNRLLEAINNQLAVQRETNDRLEDGFRRLQSAVEDTGPRM